MNDQNDTPPAEPTEEDLATQRAIDEEELELAEIDAAQAAEDEAGPVKLPSRLSALEQAGAQAYLQQILGLGQTAQATPLEAIDAVLAIVEHDQAEARIKNAPPEMLIQFDAQIDIIKAVRKLNRDLHASITRLEARAKLMQPGVVPAHQNGGPS